VEPRGIEPLTSALPARHEGLQEFSGECKMPANSSILIMILFSTVQEIYSGCCTVAAKWLRIASTKVRDDRYSASHPEAIYATFTTLDDCTVC